MYLDVVTVFGGRSGIWGTIYLPMMFNFDVNSSFLEIINTLNPYPIFYVIA